MKILTVKMQWNEGQNRWDTYVKGLGFVFDFPPCENIKKIFEGLNEKEMKKFKVIIKPVED